MFMTNCSILWLYMKNSSQTFSVNLRVSKSKAEVLPKLLLPNQAARGPWPEQVFQKLFQISMVVVAPSICYSTTRLRSSSSNTKSLKNLIYFYNAF